MDVFGVDGLYGFGPADYIGISPTCQFQNGQQIPSKLFTRSDEKRDFRKHLQGNVFAAPRSRRENTLADSSFVSRTHFFAISTAGDVVIERQMSLRFSSSRRTSAMMEPQWRRIFGNPGCRRNIGEGPTDFGVARPTTARF